MGEVQQKIYSRQQLEEFTINVFLKMGVPPEDAASAAAVLIAADLRGIDSHGVARLSGYVRLWEKKRINATPGIKITHETPSTATLDGDAGLGLLVAQEAMKIAIAKAQNSGSGWVAVKNSNHFGIAGYHAMMALEHDMIGMAMTNASPLVAPAQSVERLLGTNPMCYAIPAGKHEAVVVDMATSAAANGKLEIAQRTGKKIPSGWVQDAEGNSSTDPDGLKKGGSLLPLGSDADRGFHKGFGLSAVVDIFSGVLSGANYGPWVPPFVSFLPLDPNPVGKGIGHFLGAMRIDGFRPKQEFKKEMDNWIERFKNAKPAAGFEGVIIPGEPEMKSYRERLISGIPVNGNVVADLQQLANTLGIDFIK
jgi:LDH2 family malate/lactate/ureidoglycolate dehydrogenase